MGGFIKVPEVAFHSFIDWYMSNVGEVTSHSVMPADRIVVIGVNNTSIGYIEFMYETRHFIREDLYKYFVENA